MKINYYKSFSIIIIAIILFVTISCILNSDYINSTKKYDLKKDGCCIIKKVLSSEEVELLKQECTNVNYKSTKEYLMNHSILNKIISEKMPQGYQFQDYILVIQKSAVHTCHRDNNGDFFNSGQKHPSYTAIFYLEDMEKCLGVIPTSHQNRNSFNFNVSNRVENLLCKKGDMILFNSNLIHVGTTNTQKDHLRIQMKITHKDDLEVLSYYQNYNKVLNQDNTLPESVIRFQKNISCMFPYISNITQKEVVKTTKDSYKIGYFQRIFSYLFYGNSTFYDLPNAF